MMNFSRKPISPRAEASLKAAIAPWVGTPYRPGHQQPGVGCDCRSFVLGVLDQLYGTQTALELLPEDAALHQPEVSRSFLRKMARLWDVEKVTDNVLEPGDVIICAYPGAGPTHVILSGPWPRFYHATSDGVAMTSFGLSGLEFHSHYRLPGKENW